MVYGAEMPTFSFDIVALAVFVGLWSAYSVLAEHPLFARHRLARTTEELRILWMRRMCDRENRITDSTLLASLMRSVSFFASASMLILSGLVALIGSGERGFEVFKTLPLPSPGTVEQFEAHLGLLSCVFIYAFFQMTWSLRQFNYCCILVGACPLPKDAQSRKDAFAHQAGRLQALAADSFNRGLRAYYFALAMLAWFFSAWAFMGATLLVVVIMVRREFRSKSLGSLHAALAAADWEEKDVS